MSIIVPALQNQFPTSPPIALGGTTPAVQVSTARGKLSATAANGSAVVTLLVWNATMSRWDYVEDQPTQFQVKPDSTVAGGLADNSFVNATPAYYSAIVTTSLPSNSLSNLVVDIGDLASTQGPGLAQIIQIGPVAAASATAVHASYAGNSAANLFPGPITNPNWPRVLTAVAAAMYDGGALTVVGFDQLDRAQTEVITPVAAMTVSGVKIWKTVVSITKAAVGANAAGVSVGTGASLGLPKRIAAPLPPLTYLAATGVLDLATAILLDPTYAFTPTTPPATTTYLMIANVV